MTYYFPKRGQDLEFLHPELRDFYSVALTSVSNTNFLAPYSDEIPIEQRRELKNQRENHISEMYASGAVALPYDKQVMVSPIEDAEFPIEICLSITYPPNYNPAKKHPAVLYFAGGAMVHCMESSAPLRELAERLDAVAFSVKYRSILDEGGFYPGQVDDCHAAYKYVHDNAKELGINKNKILIMGESTGAHLALSLCHRLKRYGYSPRGCLALVPIVDERAIYPSSNYADSAWDGESIHVSSNYWLHNKPSHFVSPEAFANHATVEDCIGLAPTIIYEAQNEPSLDPILQYYSKLTQAGVFSSLRTYGGLVHACMSAPLPYSKKIFDSQIADLLDMIENDFRHPYTLEDAQKSL